MDNFLISLITSDLIDNEITSLSLKYTKGPGIEQITAYHKEENHGQKF